MLKRMIENGFVLKETIEMKYPEKKNQNRFWRRRVSTYIYLACLLCSQGYQYQEIKINSLYQGLFIFK